MTEKSEFKIETIPNNGVLDTLVKAEIDMQIATAKAFPRDLVEAKKEMLGLATSSQEVAELCAYALPRKQKNEKTGQYEQVILQGPSVRLAEIVVYCYGNIRAGARTIGNDGRRVKSQGFCHDLQKNNFNAFEVERKITNKAGATFSEDMQIVTANAASKIAYRNAVLTTIPMAFYNDVYQAVLKMIKGTQETLAPRRERAMAWFAAKNVTKEQIFELLDVKEMESIDLEKLQILSGMKASIVNGEFSVEDLFAKEGNPNGKTGSEKATDETLNMMEGKRGRK